MQLHLKLEYQYKEINNQMGQTFPDLNEVYPGIHHKKLKEFFKQFKNDESEKKLKELCKEINIFFVCFTNRCGSNLICQAISSSGKVKQPGENLNFNTVINNSKQKGFSDFAEYLCWLLLQGSQSNKNVGIKCSVDQLIQLYNYGLLQQMGKTKFILVTRKNTIKQAISMVVALQTQQWTSTQSIEEERKEIKLDIHQTIKIAIRIRQQNSVFRMVLDLIGSPPTEIGYEEFIKDPEKHMEIISEALEIPELEYKEKDITYKKQATKINEEFYQQIKKEFLTEEILE